MDEIPPQNLMTDQLQITGVAPPPAQEAATPPGRASHHTASSGHPSGRTNPPRPSATAVLRGYCPYCGKWPKVGETTGELLGHQYPKWDFHGRRGRCAGSGTTPPEPKWAEPAR